MLKTSNLIIVGYETEARSDTNEFVPEFEADKSCKTPEAKAKNITAKITNWQGTRADRPWMGQLKRIVALDTLRTVFLDSDDCQAGDIPVDWFANYLRSMIADEKWYDRDGNLGEDGPVRMVGFNIRRFVKFVGLGAAEARLYLPHSLWYGADYRGTEEMLLPKPECTGVPLSVALNRLQIRRPDACYQYGNDAAVDCFVTLQVVSKLSLFPEFTKHLDIGSPFRQPCPGTGYAKLVTAVNKLRVAAGDKVAARLNKKKKKKKRVATA